MIDEELGLCYVRVPTWLPCRLQIYFNGHNWLAARLRKQKIDYRLMDNAYVHIADWARAQQIADELDINRLHRRLDQFARRFCPIHRSFGVAYHWSVDQCEYATDIVFRKQADLQPLYENLSRTAIHTVKPDNIATFLGKKLVPQFEGKMGNRFNVRIEGTRIKHTMGSVSLKLYDKFGLILRIETTVHDLTFFKHYREVDHRDGSRETKWTSMQKTIYSLPALRELLAAANRRYLEFLSTIEDPRNGRDKLDKLSRPQRHEGRSYPGFNFFDSDDDALFRAIARGEFNISGVQNPAPVPVGQEQQPGVPTAQTPAPAWPHSKGRARLQVLPDSIQQTGHCNRPEAARTGHHPATCLRTGCITQQFSARFVQNLNGEVLNPQFLKQLFFMQVYLLLSAR